LILEHASRVFQGLVLAQTLRVFYAGGGGEEKSFPDEENL
jgi:hypothetical protein